MKALLSIIFLGIALIPTWIWVISYNFLSPESFKLVFFGLVVWFLVLGAIQIVLLVVWVAVVVIMIWGRA